MTWRIAHSLDTLRDQVNKLYPGRSTRNDGDIGDAAHQATVSDHNPDPAGIVRALDLTHDPAHGFDAAQFAEALRRNKDPRLRYVIHNGRIFNSTVSPWVWRERNKGPGDHTEHVHISVVGADGANDPADDPSAWNLSNAASPPVEAGWQSGRGSWYSQNPPVWVDHSDQPNSNALGVPDSQQGCAFYNRATLGQWFDVRAPNGVTQTLQQTDIGPNPSTGRKIDIAAVAAERFGYTPDTFPTDGIFSWRPVVVQPKPPDPIIIPPSPPGPTPMPKNQAVEDCLAELTAAQRPIIEKYVSSNDGGAAAVRAELIRMLGGVVPTTALPPPALMPATSTPAQPLSTPISAIQKPSVQASAIALALSTILQATGAVGTPFGMGEAPTQVGTITTLAPLLTGLVGATGGWGALLQLVAGLAANATKPK